MQAIYHDMRTLAPSGTPITLRDIGSWVSSFASPERTLEEFRAAVCERFSVKHCFFVSSGRAALCVLFSVFKDMDGRQRREVVLPSYTCYSVPSTVAKSGLRVRICDIDPDTLDFSKTELERTDFSNVLCLVTANLYGLPNDLPWLERFARDKGVFLIDDASQCMGGLAAGRFSGTFGDAGVFSLDKGKNITSLQGGIIVTDSDEIARAVRAKIEALPSQPAEQLASYAAKLLAYAALLNPSAYWLPSRIPFLGLGKTVYSTDYPVEKYNPMLGGLAATLFKRFEQITEARVRNGQEYLRVLGSIRGIRPVDTVDRTSPVYLRFPVLAEDSLTRAVLLSELERRGMGATASFPRSIADLDEIKSIVSSSAAVNGRAVAERIMTLPTHPFVTADDIHKIAHILKACA